MYRYIVHVIIHYLSLLHRLDPLGTLSIPFLHNRRCPWWETWRRWFIRPWITLTRFVVVCCIQSSFHSTLQGHWIPTQRKNRVCWLKLGSHSVQILKNDFLICFIGLLQKYLSRDLNFIRLVPIHEPSSDKSTVYFSFCWYPMPL